MLTDRIGVRGLIARTNDDADLFDMGAEHLFDDDREDRFLDAVAVYECLERQSALIATGGGDDGFAELH